MQTIFNLEALEKSYQKTFFFYFLRHQPGDGKETFYWSKLSHQKLDTVTFVCCLKKLAVSSKLSEKLPWFCVRETLPLPPCNVLALNYEGL